MNGAKQINDTKESAMKTIHIFSTISLLLCILVSSTVFAESDLYPRVGAIYITDFKGFNTNAPGFGESAKGFYDEIRWLSNWSAGFILGEQYAWEADLKSLSNHGLEDLCIDNVDFAIVATHGWLNPPSSDPYYGGLQLNVLDFTPNSHFLSTDNGFVTPGEAVHAWGNKNLEWLCLDSCAILSDEKRGGFPLDSYWSNCMDGLHLLVGFSNTMYTYSDGFLLGGLTAGSLAKIPYFVPRTVLQAWFETVDHYQEKGVTGKVLAEVSDNFNDYIWGKGYTSPDPVRDAWFWKISHASTKKTSGSGTSGGDSYPAVVKLYQVNSRSIDSSYIRSLARTMNLSTRYGYDERLDFFYANGEGKQTMTIDRETGIYNYLDLDRMWVPQERSPELPAPSEAAEMVIEFLSNNGLLPDDAILEDVITEHFDKVNRDNGETVERQDSNRQVIFSRVLNASDEGYEAPVTGPGAKMMAYVDETGIIGLKGGYRNVDYVDDVEIISADEAWELLLAHKSDILLATPGLPLDELVRLDAHFGYYEKGIGQYQEYLIPAWIFDVEFFSNDMNQGNGQLIVPASERFYPLVSTITSPANNDVFGEGEMIELRGTADYGQAPYTFEWTSDSDGFLGNGDVIRTTLNSNERDGFILQNTITLTVTDANGQKKSSVIGLEIMP